MRRSALSAHEAEPTGVNVCHCRMCQKASGGPFMAFGGVRMSEFVVTRGVDLDLCQFGHRRARLLRAMRNAADLSSASAADRVSVTLGSLDDPNAVEPTTQLGVESSVRWLAALARRSGDAYRAMARAEEDRRRRTIASIPITKLERRARLARQGEYQ